MIGSEGGGTGNGARVKARNKGPYDAGGKVCDKRIEEEEHDGFRDVV